MLKYSILGDREV